MFKRFFQGLQQDFKGFVYFNILFMLFRIGFLCAFSVLTLASTKEDLLLTLWYGGRTSLKTAGVVMAISFLVATLPKIFIKYYPSNAIRKIWHDIATLFFTFLFVARIPYYKVYSSGYNLMLVNGTKDDLSAIYETLVEQYDLWGNLLHIFLLTAFFCYIVNRLFETKTLELENSRGAKVALVFILPLFFIFTRFGGGYSYDTGIHWESAARLNSNFLNETILDDGQALYRTYSIYERMKHEQKEELMVEKLRDSIKALGGNPQATTLEEAFFRQNTRKLPPLNPEQVVVIFGENHALWPFLERYKDLHLADREKELLTSTNAASLPKMLAGGNGTMTSLNTLVSGLPDAGIYFNYEQETVKSKYATGIGNAMHKLGYKTVFWYGGLATWQNIEQYVKYQGFDEFHCVNDLASTEQGVWGMPDATLFEEIQKYMAREGKGTKVFHFVLTTSNHPPYSLDVNALGFPVEEVRKNLPMSIANTKDNLQQLGHIWYSDKTISAFVEATQKIAPNALFVITGDHAERFSFAKEENLEALSAVPCIFYGKGISKTMFDEKRVGAHEQIIPTLVELLSPEGYTYSSILPSLLIHNTITFNQYLYAYEGNMESLSRLKDSSLSQEVKEEIAAREKAARIVTNWRANKGNTIY